MIKYIDSIDKDFKWILGTGTVIIDSLYISYAETINNKKRLPYPITQRTNPILDLLSFIEMVIAHERVVFIERGYRLPNESFKEPVIPKLNVPEDFLFEVSQTAFETVLDMGRLETDKTKAEAHVLATMISADELLLSAFTGIPFATTTYKHNDSYNELAHILNPIANKNYYQHFLDRTMDLVSMEARKEADQMNRFLPEARFTVETPLISSMVLKQANNPEDILEIAFNIRASKEARAFRKILKDFDSAARLGDSNSMFRIKGDIEQAVMTLRNKQKTESVFELSIQIYPPAISVDLTKLWKGIVDKQQNYLIFLRNLFDVAKQDEGLNRAINRIF